MAEERLRFRVDFAFGGALELRLRVGGERSFYSLTAAGITESRHLSDEVALSLLESAHRAQQLPVDGEQHDLLWLDGFSVTVTHVDASGSIQTLRSDNPEPVTQPRLCALAAAMVEAARAAGGSAEAVAALDQLAMCVASRG